MEVSFRKVFRSTLGAKNWMNAIVAVRESSRNKWKDISKGYGVSIQFCRFVVGCEKR